MFEATVPDHEKNVCGLYPTEYFLDLLDRFVSDQPKRGLSLSVLIKL